MENTLKERITIDPNICHGKPCIRGLRYPVEFILELLSSGMNIDEILDDYDDLERDDILATIIYQSPNPPGNQFPDCRDVTCNVSTSRLKPTDTYQIPGFVIAPRGAGLY